MPRNESTDRDNEENVKEEIQTGFTKLSLSHTHTHPALILIFVYFYKGVIIFQCPEENGTGAHFANILGA